MKQLIIPIAIGLLAGLGGGTGYSYMRTAAKHTADSTQVADSLKAHPPADSASAEHETAAHDTTTHDSSAHDSTASASVGHGMDVPGLHEPAAPTTPADSLRAVEAIRHDAKATPATQNTLVPEAKGAATVPVTTVKDASTSALRSSLPEQRLAKIFGAMAAKDAAKVLDQMTDADIRTILGMMNDRQAASILSSFSAGRAAAISRGSSKVPGGTP